VLIEGLPGIGNVGKVAIDFIIDQTDAKKVYEFFSFSFPNSVFVNEDNLVDLPTIELYHVRQGKRDFLLLAGDTQPTEEVASYSFSDRVLSLAKDNGVGEVITLGGIGLSKPPKNAKVYCTGNSKKIVSKYCRDTKVNHKLFGVVGPIIGVSGVMLGLAKRYDMDAISLLAETYSHPMFIGVKGARKILEVLDKKLAFGLDLTIIDQEIKEIEEEMKGRSKRLSESAHTSSLAKFKKFGSDTTYIG
jgi:hypothetical protein